jgi:hypothetical protein
MNTAQFTLDHAGLTVCQVQATLPLVLVPTTSTTSTSELKTRRKRTVRNPRPDFAARHAAKVQRLMREAVPAVELKDRRLLRLCLETAVANHIPMNAILSRMRHKPVVAARDELWRRVNVELRMTPTQIARVFNYTIPAVQESLARS